jgi:hypothetical protein
MFNASLPSLPPLPISLLLIDPYVTQLRAYLPLLLAALVGMLGTLFWTWLTGPNKMTGKRKGKSFDNKSSKVGWLGLTGSKMGVGI